MRSEVEEVVMNLKREFERLDKIFGSEGLSLEEKRELALWVQMEQLVPRCTHSFTKYLGRSFSSSFRVNRMLDQPLMVRFLGGRNRINQKDGGKDFAEKLGLKIPITYGSRLNWSQIKEVYPGGVVIKPTEGSQSTGAFGLVSDGGGVLDCFSGTRYCSMGRFKEVNESVGEWEVEELIITNSESESFSPAVDVKFYVFYGEVCLVLQVDRWSGSKKYHWFDSDGASVETGIYKNSSDCRVAKPLYSAEDLKMVRKASRELPAPFCRIDFLKGESGLVFGEFTFNSGAPGAFSSLWDKKMGEAFVRAKKRLMRDFLEGKKFSHYQDVNFV